MVNDRRYQQVWSMNKEKANELLEQINNIDKSIHEEILGLGWSPPTVPLLRQADLPSVQRAAACGEPPEKYADGDADKSKINTESVVDLKSTESLQIKNRLVNHILRMLADRSGFLIEERLWPLLEKYEQVPIVVCKLDNIFNALEIDNIEDVHILCEYFMNYVYCPSCRDPGTTSHGDTRRSIESAPKQEGNYEEKNEERSPTAPEKVQDLLMHSDQLLLEEAGVMIKKCTSHSGQAEGAAGEEEGRTAGSWARCAQGHWLQLSVAHALAALRDFLANTPSVGTVAPNITYVAMSRYMKAEDVALYWDRYKMIFSPHKEKLWDGILLGLNKYLPILQDRQKLNEEVLQLRKQNVELRHLLRGPTPADHRARHKCLPPLPARHKVR